MSRIRVLIVDDAVVIRRIVSDVLASDPGIEVAGIAANGKIALAKIPQVNPDLVTMDVEMPEMDGLTAVREIRKLYPRLPVVMFSTLTARGASTVLDALAAGANDYVTKPVNVGNIQAAMQRIREELIPKIKGLCAKVAAPEVAAGLMRATPPRAPAPSAMNSSARVELVVIGISTGGPNALAEVIPALPRELPVPVLIVQHMPPVFTRVLAERLDQKSRLSVKEAQDGDEVVPGRVYLAPGDYHMAVQRKVSRLQVALNQEIPENSCRPAVDVLFRSAAAACGAATLGVVMTGMGQDGLRGSEAIREAGGCVIAQDEATSVVWGMPGFVAKAALAAQLVPLADIASTITRRVMEQRKACRHSA
jgi:two-component system chemotaxis response regulator CheB